MNKLPLAALGALLLSACAEFSYIDHTTRMLALARADDQRSAQRLPATNPPQQPLPSGIPAETSPRAAAAAADVATAPVTTAAPVSRLPDGKPTSAVVAAPVVHLLAEPVPPSVVQPVASASARPDTIPIVQTLRPFDVLDVIFHVDATTSREYRVQAGDEIDLTFVTAPELNGKQIVLPDGTIQLPHAGSLNVAGLSLLELRTKIGERYATILIDPEFHVSLPRAQGGLQVLRETLFHPSFGYSREITVRADGFASFPLVGDMPTTGQTIPGLVEALNARYARIERRVRVDVLLKKSALDQVFVLGEVGVPGAYQIQRPVSPLEVLAMANGVKNTARLDSVVILRRQKDEVIAQVVDLDPALAGTSGAMNYLRPDDLIYVPKTRLASVGDIVRQIGNAVLFNGIGYTFSYRVDNKGTP